MEVGKSWWRSWSSPAQVSMRRDTPSRVVSGAGAGKHHAGNGLPLGADTWYPSTSDNDDGSTANGARDRGILVVPLRDAARFSPGGHERHAIAGIGHMPLAWARHGRIAAAGMGNDSVNILNANRVRSGVDMKGVAKAAMEELVLASAPAPAPASLLERNARKPQIPQRVLDRSVRALASQYMLDKTHGAADTANAALVSTDMMSKVLAMMKNEGAVGLSPTAVRITMLAWGDGCAAVGDSCPLAVCDSRGVVVVFSLSDACDSYIGWERIGQLDVSTNSWPSDGSGVANGTSTSNHADAAARSAAPSSSKALANGEAKTAQRQQRGGGKATKPSSNRKKRSREPDVVVPAQTENPNDAPQQRRSSRVAASVAMQKLARVKEENDDDEDDDEDEEEYKEQQQVRQRRGRVARASTSTPRTGKATNSANRKKRTREPDVVVPAQTEDPNDAPQQRRSSRVAASVAMQKLARVKEENDDDEDDDEDEEEYKEQQQVRQRRGRVARASTSMPRTGKTSNSADKLQSTKGAASSSKKSSKKGGGLKNTEIEETTAARLARVQRQPCLRERHWLSDKCKDLKTLELEEEIDSQEPQTKRAVLMHFARLAMQLFLDMVSTLTRSQRSKHKKGKHIDGNEKRALNIAMNEVTRRVAKTNLLRKWKLKKSQIDRECHVKIRKVMNVISGTATDYDKSLLTKEVNKMAYIRIAEEEAASAPPPPPEEPKPPPQQKEKPKVSAEKKMLESTKSNTAPSGMARRTLPIEVDMPCSMAWSDSFLLEDGSSTAILAVGQESGSVILWMWTRSVGSMTSSRETQTRFEAHNQNVVAVAWAKYAMRQPSLDTDDSELLCHGTSVTGSDLLVTASSSGTIGIWQIRLSVLGSGTSPHVDTLNHRMLIPEPGPTLCSTILSLGILLETDEETQAKCLRIASTNALRHIQIFTCTVATAAATTTTDSFVLAEDRRVVNETALASVTADPADRLEWVDGRTLYSLNGGELFRWTISGDLDVSFHSSWLATNRIRGYIVVAFVMSPSRTMFACTIKDNHDQSFVLLSFVQADTVDEEHVTVSVAIPRKAEGALDARALRTLSMRVPSLVNYVAERAIRDNRVIGFFELMRVLHVQKMEARKRGGGEVSNESITSTLAALAHRMLQVDADAGCVTCHTQLAYALLITFADVAPWKGEDDDNVELKMLWDDVTHRATVALMRSHLRWLARIASGNSATGSLAFANDSGDHRKFAIHALQRAMRSWESNPNFALLREDHDDSMYDYLAHAVRCSVGSDDDANGHDGLITNGNDGGEQDETQLEQCTYSFAACTGDVFRCTCCERAYSAASVRELRLLAPTQPFCSCYMCGTPLERDSDVVGMFTLL